MKMKRKLFFVLPMVVLIVLLLGGIVCAKPAIPSARTINPIVSTDWLAVNGDLDNLVILDIRTAGEYAAGHIYNAINAPFEVPFCAWLTMRGEFLLEVPEETALFNAIGSLGITKNSKVVIITSMATAPDPPYPLANATRVADTLVYAGVKNVAILDGGFTKWVTEGKPVTTAVPTVNPVTYQGRANKEMIVSIEYVQKHIGKSVIIDARDAEVYFGVTTESWAQKAGHVPTAKSLPTPWMLNQDGTFKSQAVLEEMASGVISGISLPGPWKWNSDGTYNHRELEAIISWMKDKCKEKEIIVYCGVGGYASSWWFVLTQVLGYDNVKIFDGSAQEWSMYNEMVKYTWSF